MRVEVVPVLVDNFAFVVHEGGEAVVVDPGEAAPVLSLLDRLKLKPRAALLTHHHPDHVGGVTHLARVHPLEVYCSRVDLTRIRGATRAVEDGDALDLLGRIVTVIATPGHTRGHVVYHFAADALIFTGDTLFSGGCGRVLEGSATELHQSLARLRQLPDLTRVYFGHEYTLNNLAFIRSRLAPERAAAVRSFETQCRAALDRDQPTVPTTIAAEKAINPLFNARDAAEFSAWRSARDVW